MNDSVKEQKQIIDNYGSVKMMKVTNLEDAKSVSIPTIQPSMPTVFAGKCCHE